MQAWGEISRVKVLQKCTKSYVVTYKNKTVSVAV